MTATPWGSPPPSSSEFSLNDHMGQPILFAVGGTHPAVITAYGTRPAIRANVVVFPGGDEILDVLIFNARVVRRLRGCAGQVIFGRIVAEPSKAGNNPAVDIAPATPEDEELARGWVAYYPNRLEELVKLAQESFEAEEKRGPAGTASSSPPPRQGWTQPSLPPAPMPAKENVNPKWLPPSQSSSDEPPF